MRYEKDSVKTVLYHMEGRIFEDRAKKLYHDVPNTSAHLRRTGFQIKTSNFNRMLFAPTPTTQGVTHLA